MPSYLGQPQNLILAGFFALLMCGNAVSSEIYQWHDADGKLHFVDDPAKVPPEHRVKARRYLSPLQPTSSVGTVMSLDKAEGKLKWQTQCAACHFTGPDKERGKIDLSGFLINDITKFPESQTQVVWEFRRAADGHYSDMDKIEISDDELKLIAAYLLHIKK